MTKKTYDYTEDNFFLPRRTFLKVGGALAVALALPLQWVASKIANRNAHIEARTAGLYQDDKIAKVRESHSNQVMMNYYREFGGEPMGKLSHDLLHTKYVDRTKLHS
ncbi:iron hydrogenase small subunit [Ferrimonas senticii]|uniref:iron hydrogenase small subunit n=1 Tax=Ferrimonas senticii TaxID=394566 RepID=UPI0004131471|nr:iron hydrogenase small subunit [Ferrimonas senticii]